MKVTLESLQTGQAAGEAECSTDSALFWIEERTDKNVLCINLNNMSEEAKARVAWNFNPSGKPRITLAKALSMGAIELALEMGKHESARVGRACATAATHFEAGQMFLVKGIAHSLKL